MRQPGLKSLPPLFDLFSLQQLTHGLAYMTGNEGGSFAGT
jgi:hypothetical protein